MIGYCTDATGILLHHFDNYFRNTSEPLQACLRQHKTRMVHVTGIAVYCIHAHTAAYLSCCNNLSTAYCTVQALLRFSDIVQDIHDIDFELVLLLRHHYEISKHGMNCKFSGFAHIPSAQVNLLYAVPIYTRQEQKSHVAYRHLLEKHFGVTSWHFVRIQATPARPASAEPTACFTSSFRVP